MFCALEIIMMMFDVKFTNIDNDIQYCLQTTSIDAEQIRWYLQLFIEFEIKVDEINTPKTVNRL